MKGKQLINSIISQDYSLMNRKLRDQIQRNSTKETAAVQVELLVLTRAATGLVLESSGTIKSTKKRQYKSTACERLINIHPWKRQSSCRFHSRSNGNHKVSANGCREGGRRAQDGDEVEHGMGSETESSCCCPFHALPLPWLSSPPLLFLSSHLITSVLLSAFFCLLFSFTMQGAGIV